MSRQAIEWAWVQRDVESPMRMLVLLHMADSASPGNNNESWFSVAGVAKRCRMSRRTVQTHIAGLVESGHLTLVRKGGPSAGTNRYRVNVGTVMAQTGPAGSDAPMEEIGSAAPAPHSAGDALGSAGAAPDPSAGAAHKPTTTEPVKEPIGDGRRPRARMTPTESIAVARMWNEMAEANGLATVDLSLWPTSQSHERLRKTSERSELFRDMAFYEALFEAIPEDDGLCGRRDPKPGQKKSWRVTLHWLAERDNLQKVYEQLRSEATA